LAAAVAAYTVVDVASRRWPPGQVDPNAEFADEDEQWADGLTRALIGALDRIARVAEVPIENHWEQLVRTDDA
jgi:hypothetical protein